MNEWMKGKGKTIYYYMLPMSGYHNWIKVLTNTNLLRGFAVIVRR